MNDDLFSVEMLEIVQGNQIPDVEAMRNISEIGRSSRSPDHAENHPESEKLQTDGNSQDDALKKDLDDLFDWATNTVQKKTNKT